MADIEYSDASRFWTELFEQEQLAPKLHQLLSLNSSSHHLANFGDLELRVSCATSLGDGYLSDTYALTAHVDSGACYTAFVKTLPTNPFLRSPAISQRVFNREEAIYRYLHVELRKIRNQAGFTNPEIPLNVPIMYYGSVKEDTADSADGGQANYEPVIVLENLKIQGFAMVDVRTGCNFQEARATLTTLANFHAMGMVLLRQHKTPDGEYALPDTLSFMKEKLLFDDMGPEMLAPVLPAYIESVKRLGRTDAASWLEKLSKSLKEILLPEDVRKCGPLTTILHGDCWNNNMMYRTDEDGSVKMRLIDWQITRLGHPVTDCLHFLFNSTSPELRAAHFDQLMDGYFKTLDGALQRLGIHLEKEGYTNNEFRQDIRKRLRWALFFCLMMLPGMLDQNLVDEASNYTEDDVNRLKSDGRKPEDDLLEMKDKWTSMLNADNIVANKLLSDRIVKTVLEVKAALDS